MLIRENNIPYYENKEIECNTKIKFMEVNNMAYVITNDGIRMSYDEYLGMMEAERN